MTDHTKGEQRTTAETPAKRQRVSRQSGARPTANPRQRKPSPQRTLIETKGPAPATPLGDVRLAVGRLAGSHGVHGELKMRVLTDNPDHLRKITKVYLGDDPVPIKLLGYRPHGDLALIRLEGVTTPERAKQMGGLTVRIAGEDARPLEEGEYFLYQLVGLQALDAEGNLLGTVSDLMETGAHDVLVITRENLPDLLVPNHPEFVLDVRPESGIIVLRPPVYPEAG